MVHYYVHEDLNNGFSKSLTLCKIVPFHLALHRQVKYIRVQNTFSKVLFEFLLTLFHSIVFYLYQ